MAENTQTNSENILALIGGEPSSIVGITGSPSDTLAIEIDITEESRAERVLGEMVYVVLEEDSQKVLVIGQVISVQTKNRWHEDMAFKGVIKRHGRLPHLSGHADNRIATISVQACYSLRNEDPQGHILGMSPSTGEPVLKMSNEVMNALIKNHEKAITYIGKVYGTDVNLPMWFKHFDKTKNDEEGAGDAYHIGVFGKTGSGKTVTASMTLLGYVKNKQNMNILVLDPQGQFFLDGGDLLPNGKKLLDEVQNLGMTPYKFRILEDIYLPSNEFELFANLLQKSGFIHRAFKITTPDKETEAAHAIANYLSNWYQNSRGTQPKLDQMNDEATSKDLMKKVLKKFAETKKNDHDKVEYSPYLSDVYSTSSPRIKDIVRNLNALLANDERLNEIWERYWSPVGRLFSAQKDDGTDKKTLEDVVALVGSEENKGNLVILDMSEKGGRELRENLQAMFVKMIQSRLVDIGEKFYSESKKVNCLVVMDEAHRFISDKSSDVQIKELTAEIVDAARTTRKFGIGYMFITQTIESLNEEILRQMRIFAFGYGLTTGSEFRKVSEIINSKEAETLYRSFIDPSSNGRFPFMVYGPISPLSFTGSPLFLEVYTDFGDFK